MGLLKLKKNQIGFDARKKAKEIISQLSKKSEVTSVYLFGSGASDTMTPDSDLDLLVIVKNAAVIKELIKEVSQIGFTDIAVDWIFKTEAEFEERKELGGVCFEASHYGVKIENG